jgi:hypothetical protein
VRLVRGSHGLPAGTEGTVAGFYARKPPAVLVDFGEVVLELAPDEIEAAEPPESVEPAGDS